MSNLLIEARDSPIHGHGVFARSPIGSGDPVVEYVGERISATEAARREARRRERVRTGGDESVFVFQIDDDWAIDGSSEENVARWVNHSCAPNCRSEIDDGRIWLVASRDIAPGEELTFDYGFTFREGLEHPCHCGAPECVGFIISAHQRWRLRPRARRTKPKSC